jgi:polyferredoxin
MAALNKRDKKKVLMARRASQLIFLCAFFVLFLKTDYNGTDHLNSAVNVLFRMDPFLAACVMLGVRTLEALFWPSLFVVLLCLATGRAFCGWFCPMGSLLDVTRPVWRGVKRNNTTRWPNLGKLLLVLALFSSLAGFSGAGYLDPFSLLVRGMATALYPAVNSLTVQFFTFTYQEMPPFINSVTEPFYALLRAGVLPADQKFFQLAYLSLAILLAVFLLEGVQHRFFCRNICPLGALLGFVGKYNLLSVRTGDDDCKSCRLCATVCRMGAVDELRSIDMSRCNLCHECVSKCPRRILGFSFLPGLRVERSVFLGRRKFVGAALAGLCIPALKPIDTLAQRPDPLLIRPPGALAEPEFISRCIRCGECLQVCIGNALQPVFLRAGVDGMFSPVLVARVGYCEFNCTLCGQVCPTGAIQPLEVKDKQLRKIGHAWFDRNRCLPYAKNVPCMVCEEHCPTPEKAIRFNHVEVEDADGRPVTLKQPYVVDGQCIGCGICETKCPLPGDAAIYVTSAGEQRHPDRSFLPVEQTVNPYS